MLKLKSRFLILGLSFLGTNAVIGAPYYVGENPTPETTAFFNFTNTFTSENLDPAGDTGNIAQLKLQAYKTLTPTLSVGAGLPVFAATSSAVGHHESGLGDINLGANYNVSMSTSADETRWGYTVSGDVFMPTARNSEAATVAAANPATEFYSFSPYTSSITPRAGLFVSQNFWSAKTNLGYGYQYISKDSKSAGDKNRNTWTYQIAGSIHPTSFANINLEYNTIWLDKKTAGGRAKYRQTISPSISGRVGPVVGGIFVTVPLDDATRDVSTLAAGLNAGVSF